MAIEKTNFKVSRFDSEFCHGSGESMSTDEGELQPRILAVESDDNVDDGFEDVDSGAGSDDFDFLELAEAGAEFCKVGNVTCSIPFDLYDLSGLEDILSVDVWNESLTEEERLYLVKFLPDMDQHVFMRTLKELFEGSNFHFGSPINKLFEMLKSGECEPRNALYLEGRNFFQRTKHCHQLRKYHNDMVVNLCQIRNAWSNCKGYSMHEKLRILNIMRSQKKLMDEKVEDFGANSTDRDESVDVLWSRRAKVSKSTGKKFGGPNKAAFRASRMFSSSEDTESDSSEQYHNDVERNPILWSKLAYSGDGMDGPRSLPKSKGNGRRAKLGKKDTQENEWALDGVSGYAKNLGSLSEHVYMAGAENYLSKARLKRKLPEDSPLDNYTLRDYEDNSTSGLQRFKNEDDRREISRLGKNKRPRQLHPGDSLPRSFRNKESFDEADHLPELRSLVNNSCGGRASREGFVVEEHISDVGAKLEPDCGRVKKKRKVKESFIEIGRANENCPQSFDDHQPNDDPISTKKKGKKKLEADAGSPILVTPETQRTEMEATDVDTEIKSQKKPFTLITPTVHTGFSFSIIHLLSAVRMAMISARPEDSLETARMSEELNGGHVGEETGVSSTDADTNKLHPLPSLTVPEIVNCVRSNPGDPCILETQEPLQDLVRGVLKIFSSKTSPLGAKGWKTLVAYEKSIKSWSWIGPVPQSLTDHETAEEVTSPEAWALPHKMLVKLVDAFASWLKNGQETLRQIGNLPEPPLSMMQCNLDEKERFKDLKAQKSLSTITASSDEVKAYFRREEFLRYSIPDRAFAYTAADGRKSIVAPLRRGGGKPTSKARDHFMLKRDRPPHVTILCLVRDAAARLPGSTGTRADVCTLIRDSQYIVEDVSDVQVNQVVSGALDRLHYEQDPCVQFDNEKKLWFYLHRDREEEDFEDDGTSSTKKWKRPKKDATDRSDQGAVTIAFRANEDQSGIDLGSDLNADPTFAEENKGTEILCNDARQSAEENVDDDTPEDHTMVWNAGCSTSVQENKFLCQENSANDDFDDET